MRPTTRKVLLNVVTSVAIAAAAVVVLTPAGAFAAPGTSLGNPNVRSGPGTGYDIVNTLSPGMSVDIRQCESGWCYVSAPGSDGWVSRTYLAAADGNGGGGDVLLGPVNPGGNAGFGISVGSGGVSIGIGAGVQPQQPVVVSGGDVCFFNRSGYSGSTFCAEPGQSISNLGDWSNQISSFRNPDGYNVQVCASPNFRNCRVYTSSARDLNDLDDNISSIRID